MRQEIERRATVDRFLAHAQASGVLVADVAANLRAFLGPVEERRNQSEPLLSALSPILASWLSFGMPAELVGGGMTEVQVSDRRHQMYAPRREWMDEHGIRGNKRRIYLYLWSQLDEVFLSVRQEQVEEARKAR